MKGFIDHSPKLSRAYMDKLDREEREANEKLPIAPPKNSPQTGVKMTAEQKREKLLKQHSHCFYCNKKMDATIHQPRSITKDHVKAISMGGHKGRRNIVYCCNSCNVLKGQDDAAVFKIAIAEIIEKYGDRWLEAEKHDYGMMTGARKILAANVTKFNQGHGHEQNGALDVLRAARALIAATDSGDHASATDAMSALRSAVHRHDTAMNASGK